MTGLKGVCMRDINPVGGLQAKGGDLNKMSQGKAVLIKYHEKLEGKRRDYQPYGKISTKILLPMGTCQISGGGGGGVLPYMDYTGLIS